MFDVDIENVLEQPGPTHVRAMRVRMIGCVLGSMLRRAWNDLRAELGARRED